MKRLVLTAFCVLVIGAQVSCAGSEPALFEASDCQFPNIFGREIECGTLIVPEDRSQDDSPPLSLPVAIVKSTHANPEPDPIVILHGGPGGSAIDLIEGWMIMFRNTINRDLIVLEQRGTKYAQPVLNCPELEEPYYELYAQNLSSEAENQQAVELLKACHDRLLAEGVDPAAYTSAASAADIADLRQALGYEEWNLYGSSYGTRLALTVMRDYPTGIRSVILDAPFPPQVDLYVTKAVNAERSLELVFENCAADEACSQAYPDLRRVFYDLVDQLDTQPVTLELSRPSTKKTYDFVLNGDRLINFVFQMLYATENLPQFPRLIVDFAGGDWQELPRLIDPFANDDWAEGMYYSVQCGEESYFGSPAAVQAADAGISPRFAQAMDDDSIYEFCSVWKTASPAAIENEPVTSSIPTLVLVGEFDPITPPAWGYLTGETLSQAQIFVFPGLGHATLGEGACPYLITRAFLDEPNAPVDAACIERMKAAFAVP